MNQQRKETILKEIDYWKKNRLLPEQYCNYLLTLYSEGKHETKETSHRKVYQVFFPVFILFLLPVIFLVTYFTEISFGLQMTLNFSLVIVMIAISVFYKKKNQIYQIFYLVFGLLLFLIVSIEFIENIFINSANVIRFTVLIHCFLWFIFGKIFNLKVLKILGIVSVLLFSGFSAFQYFL